MSLTSEKTFETAIIEPLKSLLPQLTQQYKIKQMGLFGSYPRGEATPTSDIDILVEFEPDITFGLITYCQLENHLSEILGKKSIWLRKIV